MRSKLFVGARNKVKPKTLCCSFVILLFCSVQCQASGRRSPISPSGRNSVRKKGEKDLFVDMFQVSRFAGELAKSRGVFAPVRHVSVLSRHQPGARQ